MNQDKDELSKSAPEPTVPDDQQDFKSANDEAANTSGEELTAVTDDQEEDLEDDED